MSTVTASRLDQRPSLRRPDDALPRSSIGTAPMLWSHADGAPRGAGILDLDGVIAALGELDYAGWLIVEQDTTWAPPSESAVIGRRVLASTLRRLDEAGAAVETHSTGATA